MAFYPADVAGSSGKGTDHLNRKDGSPYLDDGKNNISISHTKNYAAILLHESAAVGVDIETRSERVIKMPVNSFLIRNILIRTKNCTQLLHWSAKESLFKLMNEQGIDFKQHLHIHPFIPGNKGMIAATETKTEQHSRSVYNMKSIPIMCSPGLSHLL